MKKNLSLTFIASLFAALIGFVGCDDVREFEDLNVTSVKTLLNPADNGRVDLQSSGNLLFEWEAAEAEDGSSLVYYDVLFDNASGDFSAPIHIQAADNKSLSTGATLNATALESIAEKAGAAAGQEAVVKWTVRSNRGIKTALAEQSRTLTIVRKAAAGK